VIPDVEEITYSDLRLRALEQRERAFSGEIPREMKELYNCWSDVLLEKFNVRMYEDFRGYALADGKKGNPLKLGLKKLLAYYTTVFSGQATLGNAERTYPIIFEMHYQQAKEIEQSWERETNSNGEASAFR
jgi:la-related protein 1